jgi:hypothetical protein
MCLSRDTTQSLPLTSNVWMAVEGSNTVYQVIEPENLFQFMRYLFISKVTHKLM